MKNNRVHILTECAIMVALSAVLQLIPFISLPQGGTITLASMAPIVFVALRHGVKWGLLTAFAGSTVQMLLGGISTPPVATFLWFLLVVLLDYVIAYTVLGLAPLFAAPFSKKPLVGAAVSTVAVVFLRFICHFLSGVLIWGIYAPEGWPVWLHSIVYNGSFMLPEGIITTVAVTLLVAAIGKLQKRVTA